MHVADVAVADVHLAAVEDVVVAVAFRGGLHAEDKAPGVGFGDRDCRQAVAARDGREPVSFLGFATEVQDFRHAQLRGLDHGAHGAADPGKLLDYDRFGKMTESHPAVFPPDGDTDPPLPCDEP